MQNSNHPNLIIKGTFIAAKPAQDRGSYTIREFAIDDSYYNRPGEFVERVFSLSVFGDKCAQLDQYTKGDKLVVHFNLRPGKDQNGKWKWINVSPWKIEIDVEAQARSQQQTQNPSPVSPAVIPQAETVVEADDLPF